MSGPRGYRDWQREGNFDGPLILNASAVAVPPTLASGVKDVSYLAYLGGSLQCTGTPCRVTITWYADSAATILVGTKLFVLHQSITGPDQIRIPNLGPFVQINILSISGAAATVTANVFGTNRVHPLEDIPFNPQLITQSNVLILAGASNNAFPNGYYTGPIRVWVILPAASWTFSLFGFDSGANQQWVEQLAPAASVNTAFTTIAPAGAWFVQIFNGSGANGNYWLSVTPSTSGAA